MSAVAQHTYISSGLHIIKRKWPRIMLVLSLFLLGAFLGNYSYSTALESGCKPMGALLLEFKPAVLFASGRGMIVPEALDVQQLDAFLAFESSSFSPDALPDDIAGVHLFISSSNSFSLSHWLLFYSIGWCWRIFGISHDALRFLCAFFYGMTAVALYALFRLGMGRIVAIAGTLIVMALPPFLSMAPMLRDFSKAPFILMFIAVAGALLKERHTGKKLLQYGVLMGALVGIGYGFRQDMLICLPVALFVALVAPLQGNWKWLCRLGTPFLVAGIFFVTALPPLVGVRSDSGSVSTHTLFQGLSRQAEQEMGFGDASYDLLLRPSDTEVHAVVNAHARMRGCTDSMDFYLSPAYGRVGRQIFLEWARTFPADLFARGLASIEATTRLSTLAVEYHGYKPFAASALGRKFAPYYEWYHQHIERFGALIILMALFVIAVRNIRLAVGTTLILAWFMAYPNLLFQLRHAFHLSFVTPWAALFLVASAGRFALAVLRAARSRTSSLRGTKQTDTHECTHATPDCFAPRNDMLMAFMLIMIMTVAALALLVGLRIVQRQNMATLSEAYQNAPLEAVETVVEVQNYRALVKPATRLPGLGDSWNLPLGDVAAEYLVLEFAPSEIPVPVTIYYQPNRGADFTRQIILPASTSGGKNRRYFVPVYEMTNYMPIDFFQLKHRYAHSPVANLLIHHWGVNRFVGIHLLEEDAPLLQRIYRVTDYAALPWLLYLHSDNGKEPEALCKKMRIEKELHTLPVELRLLASGDAEKAVTSYLHLLNRFPGHHSFARRVRALTPRIADPEKRADALYRLARYMPHWAGRIALDLAAIGDEFRQQKDYAEAQEIYLQALLLSPTDLGYKVKLADTLLAHGEADLALEHYRSILLVAPESHYSATQFDRICLEQGKQEEQGHFWRKLHETYPDAAVPALRQGRQLEQQDLYEEALVLYRQVEAHHPENAEALLCEGILVALMEGYAKGRVMMDKALEMSPELHPELVAGLTRIATHYTETGAHAFAEAIYREVIALAPDDGWHQVRYGEALMAQEHYNKAREVFLDILERTPESPYSANKLDEIFKLTEGAALRIDTWKSLCELHPEAYVPALHYGKAFESGGDYEQALQQYRTLHEAHPDQPEGMLRLGYATARIEDYAQGRILMDSALGKDPALTSLHQVFLAELAENYFFGGDFGPAEALYRELLPSATDKIFIEVRLAEALTAQERYDESLVFCRELIETDPEADHFASLVEALYEKKHDVKGQIEEWRNLCAVLPESLLPHIHLGMAYEADNQQENAIKVYAEALRRAPHNPHLKLRYGILVALLEDYDKGRAAMNEAFSAAPELNGEMAAGLAKIAAYKHEQGQHELAGKLYREAGVIAPDDYWHRVRLGELLMEQNRKSDALGLFVEVLMARPESPHTAALVDEIYGEQNKKTKRLETWQQINSAQPKAAVPLYHLGLALENGGKKDDAIESFSQALRIKPDYVEAQQAIDRLTNTPE